MRRQWLEAAEQKRREDKARAAQRDLEVCMHQCSRSGRQLIRDGSFDSVHSVPRRESNKRSNKRQKKLFIPSDIVRNFQRCKQQRYNIIHLHREFDHYLLADSRFFQKLKQKKAKLLEEARFQRQLARVAKEHQELQLRDELETRRQLVHERYLKGSGDGY